MGINKVQFQQGLSLDGFLTRYGTPARCYRALYRARWPEGFRYPACGERRRSRFRRGEQVYASSLTVTDPHAGAGAICWADALRCRARRRLGPTGMDRVWLSWSSGKDSAYALHVLRQQHGVEVCALLSVVNATAGRIAMHGVRRELVHAQALAAGLPLQELPLPYPCANADYESAMRETLARARASGVTHLAFGDLYLRDIRDYRVALLAGSGITPLFPLWCQAEDSAPLARTLLRAGLRAVVTCVDPKQVPAELAGRNYDEAFLAALPSGADPCGENGEFHSFCHAGPMFDRDIPVRVGEIVHRDGFVFADLLPGEAVAITSSGPA